MYEFHPVQDDVFGCVIGVKVISRKGQVSQLFVEDVFLQTVILWQDQAEPL